MTTNTYDFDEAANSLAAFKAVSAQLVKMFENDGVVYPQDEDVQPLYDQLATHAAKSHFPAMAEDFKALLEQVNSPFGEKIAALATSLAYQLQPTHIQIVNKLYLADISEHVPQFGPEIPAASIIRAEVKAQLASALGTGSNFVTTTIIDGMRDAGDYPGLSDTDRDTIAEFVEASIKNFLKDEEPDAQAAARWLDRAFYFTETPLANDFYAAISEDLYDHLPYQQKLEVLDAKISTVQDMNTGAPVTNPILLRFGKTTHDFYEEDGETLRDATYFLPTPASASPQLGFGNDLK